MGVIIRGKKGYVQFIPSKFNFLILRHLTNACRDVHIYIYKHCIVNGFWEENMVVTALISWSVSLNRPLLEPSA